MSFIEAVTSRITRILESSIDSSYGIRLKPRGLELFVWELHDLVHHKYIATIRFSGLEMLHCNKIDDETLCGFIGAKLMNSVSSANRLAGEK